ncbi:MAG: YqgE/AlgH family protein [Bacteroidales bacterium]|nr:YqgE/AlgH family protein [Bacteroidales bacterium]MCF8404854.1 YqgE/AlgH family protein [Bacteroidales bacterium]
MTDINNILTIKSNNLKPSRGRILISEPFLLDYYFKRSVVLLAEHNDEGSFGLILNKPVDMLLSDVIKDFPKFDAPIYLGGPVKTENLYFIHTLGNIIEESLEILEGLYWGGDIDHIKELISIGRLGPSQIKFFVGYSGWVSKQLDSELSRNSWVVSNINLKTVMDEDTESMWDTTLLELGGDYSYWTKFPSDPAFN